MNNLKLIAALFSLAGLLFVGFTVLFSRSTVEAPKRPAPEVFGQAPHIELTSQDATPFSSDALEGKLWVVDFFFTSCAGPCPMMTQAMHNVQQSFLGDARTQFVSISVDPETDTPERLKEYGEKYKADFANWHFLTGPMEEIQKLAVEGFKVGSVEDPVIHSTRFILVDQKGQIRGYYMGLDANELEKLIDDMVQLLETQGA